MTKHTARQWIIFQQFSQLHNLLFSIVCWIRLLLALFLFFSGDHERTNVNPPPRLLLAGHTSYSGEVIGIFAAELSFRPNSKFQEYLLGSDFASYLRTYCQRLQCQYCHLLTAVWSTNAGTENSRNVRSLHNLTTVSEFLLFHPS